MYSRTIGLTLQPSCVDWSFFYVSLVGEGIYNPDMPSEPGLFPVAVDHLHHLWNLSYTFATLNLSRNWPGGSLPNIEGKKATHEFIPQVHH